MKVFGHPPSVRPGVGPGQTASGMACFQGFREVVSSITVGPLEPRPAIYNFNIDGVAVPDPINPRMKLRARTSASIVDVPGDGTEPWNPGVVSLARVELVYVRSKVALPGRPARSGCTPRRGTTRTRPASTR